MSQQDTANTNSKTRPRKPKRQSSSELYAMQQIEREKDEKLLVAEWAYRSLNLPHGSAAFFDAGSMCLFVFREFLKRFGRPLANVTTNNFLILQEWLQHPLAGHFPVSSVGADLDAQHLAFYGKGIAEKLTGGEYRPSVTFIGTNGFGWEDGKLHFGYHAPQEREVKAVLFECPSDKKVILTTAKKIGSVSGNLLDLLSLKLYGKGHWYLVTTIPAKEEREVYDRTLAEFSKEGVKRLTSMGIHFHWMEVSRDGEGRVFARDRMDEDPTLALIEAEVLARGMSSVSSSY